MGELVDAAWKELWTTIGDRYNVEEEQRKIELAVRAEMPCYRVGLTGAGFPDCFEQNQLSTDPICPSCEARRQLQPQEVRA